MYGIVNKAIQELVVSQFGAVAWENVKKRSGIAVDFFISNQPYDDAITYQLAGAVSEETGLSLKDVLIAFGEYWVLHTGKEKYGSLMEAGGNNLKEFLVNLPNFHSRVMLIYPKLTPPEFRVSDIAENSVNIHYLSERQGLQDFVYGLLQGLGKLYNTPTKIELLQSRGEGHSHEVFSVAW
jgi:Haem-NO-binding